MLLTDWIGDFTHVAPTQAAAADSSAINPSQFDRYRCKSKCDQDVSTAPRRRVPSAAVAVAQIGSRSVQAEQRRTARS